MMVCVESHIECSLNKLRFINNYNEPQLQFFFFLNTKYFNMHTRRGEKVLKKLTLVYIQSSIASEFQLTQLVKFLMIV